MDQTTYQARTDLDLPPERRTQSNYWEAQYFKSYKELVKANKGLRRLHGKLSAMRQKLLHTYSTPKRIYVCSYCGALHLSIPRATSCCAVKIEQEIRRIKDEQIRDKVGGETHSAPAAEEADQKKVQDA